MAVAIWVVRTFWLQRFSALLVAWCERAARARRDGNAAYCDVKCQLALLIDFSVLWAGYYGKSVTLPGISVVGEGVRVAGGAVSFVFWARD